MFKSYLSETGYFKEENSLNGVIMIGHIRKVKISFVGV